MGRTGLRLFALLLLLAAPAFAQAPGGPPGQRTGIIVQDDSTNVGVCDTLNLLTGVKASTSGNGVCSVNAYIDAREKLACDGVTDDRAAFKALVEAGGAWAGKTVDFSYCTMLWSSCTSGTGDCTVATVAPGTRLIGKPGGQPTITLARRYCSGGSTPGASCNENGASDCNGGTCTYDCASGSCSGTTDKAFAHTAAATYTLLAGPTNASCTGDGTPWPCCRISGNGECDLLDQQIEVRDITINTNQIEDYGRCSNGGALDGKACRGWCSYDSAIPGFACSDAADCVTGTCINTALCPTSGQQCDTASKSPAGTGKINVIDFSGSAGVVVDGLRVNDQMNGKGVQVGVRSVVKNTKLNAPSGNTWTQPYTAFVGTFYPAVTTFGVTNGIVAGMGSQISNNALRATVTGIELQTAFGYASTTALFYRQGEIANNVVTVWADSATAVLVNAPAEVADNRVTMAGDYDFGIKLGAASDGSYVSGNNVSMGLATDTDSVGIEVGGSFTTLSGNSVDNPQDTRGTGIRVNTTTCDAFPDCVDGENVTVQGGSVSVGDNSIAIELMGLYSKVVGVTTGAGAGSQGIALGQNSQQVIVGNDIFYGAVGVGPLDRKYCDGGANDGKICKQGATTAATCTGGTCDYDDFGSNANVSDNRIAWQTQMGIYMLTGMLQVGNYVAWQTGDGIMLGDDRVNVGKVATHGSINGGLIHVYADNASLIVFPDVSNGLCTAADTPWDCCTNVDAGTCPTEVAQLAIGGISLFAVNAGAIGLDFSTSFDADSPNIQYIAFTGNTCSLSGSGAICVAMPSANQTKITNVKIDANEYGRVAAANYITNWNDSMGSAENKGVIADLVAAGCVGSTGYTYWDLPTTNPAVAACLGSNYARGVLAFADGANALSAKTSIVLPHEWSGALFADIYWGASNTTTANVVWQITGACVADTENFDPTLSSTANTVTDAVLTTTANYMNKATITLSAATNNPLNTCAADEQFQFRLFRDPTNGSDNSAATANLYRVVLRQ